MDYHKYCAKVDQEAPRGGSLRFVTFVFTVLGTAAWVYIFAFLATVL